jgi:hypothetical protein
MSKITLEPNSSGTGTFTLAAPDSDTNRTLTLPDSAGELLTATGDGSGLTGVLKPALVGVTSVDASSVETLKAAGLGGGIEPVTLSGASQDLDLDAGNFFDAGTLTADTTLTFSNLPTVAKWSYIHALSNTAAWDLSVTSSNSRDGDFNFSSVEGQPYGIVFKPDGTKMYLSGLSDVMHTYSLSTPWDVGTANRITSESLDLSTPFDWFMTSFFKPDGLELYVQQHSPAKLMQYTLTTAWDISTASYTREYTSTASGESYPAGMFFKPDGTKMYHVGTGATAVKEFSLSTPWNISTLSYVREFSVASQSTQPMEVHFKPDGTQMYVLEQQTNVGIYSYNLSTAWDISTASYNNSTGTAISNLTSNPRGMYFKPDGSRLFFVEDTTNKVFSLKVEAGPTLTLPSSVQNSPALSKDIDTTFVYDFLTTDGGATVNIIGENKF